MSLDTDLPLVEDSTQPTKRFEISQKSCRCPCHDRSEENKNNETVQLQSSDTSVSGNDSTSSKSLGNLKIVREYNDHQNLVSSMDWDSTGEFMLSCSPLNAVTIHNLWKNTVKHLYFRKQAVHSVKYVKACHNLCAVVFQSQKPVNGTAHSVFTSISKSSVKLLRKEAYDILEKNKALEASPPPPVSEEICQNEESPTKNNLRIWDLQENRFLRIFNIVSSVSLNGSFTVSRPPSNLIVTPCQDGVVRIFSADVEKALGKIKTQMGSPLAAISITGNILCVQLDKFTLQLFDLSKGLVNTDYLCLELEKLLHLDKVVPPMYHYILERQPRPGLGDLFKITNLSVYGEKGRSPTLLVTMTFFHTFDAVIIEFDLYQGQVKRIYSTTFPGEKDISVERWKLNDDTNEIRICFVPDLNSDDALLACGSLGRKIHIWSTKSPELHTVLSCSAGIPRLVKWNPEMFVLASSFDHLALWGSFDI